MGKLKDIVKEELGQIGFEIDSEEDGAYIYKNKNYPDFGFCFYLDDCIWTLQNIYDEEDKIFGVLDHPIQITSMISRMRLLLEK